MPLSRSKFRRPNGDPVDPVVQVLHATFASPWAEEPAPPEPQFNLPACYFLQPPPLKPQHLKNFQLETLFYIFYAMPQDLLQVLVLILLCESS